MHIPDSTTLNADWQKATASGAQGDCVELASIQNLMAVRQSTDPHGPALLFSKDEIAAVISSVKAGEFDHLGAS